VLDLARIAHADGCQFPPKGRVRLTETSQPLRRARQTWTAAWLGSRASIRQRQQAAGTHRCRNGCSGLPLSRAGRGPVLFAPAVRPRPSPHPHTAGAATFSKKCARRLAQPVAGSAHAGVLLARRRDQAAHVRTLNQCGADEVDSEQGRWSWDRQKRRIKRRSTERAECFQSRAQRTGESSDMRAP
jgi:hypothetical protein